VLDELGVLDEVEASVVVCFDPLERAADFCRWLGERYEYSGQVGSGLGERMKNAFVGVFSGGCRKAVLVGSDIPELSASIISRAFEELEESDAVVGPAVDGGYYLIGFCRDSFRGEVFEDVEWSRSSVFAETMEKFGTFGDEYVVGVLDELADVDTAEDYHAFIERNLE
jgi:rSAM/selenodomain-associated transferase 1